jgi:hypothetical protein
MLAAMAYNGELHERIWPIFNSEVPVTVGASGLIGRGEGCAVWVDAVYLFSSFVVVRTCLIARRERYADSNGGSVSLVDGFDDDGPSEVVTTIAVDGQSLSTSDGTLHSGDGQSGSGRAEATWWLPSIPVSRLDVGVQWLRGGLDGGLAFEAGDWRSAAGAVFAV